jgi:hypothetical protein
MKRSKVEKLQKPLSPEAVAVGSYLGEDNAGTGRHLKEYMPTIKCECGAEILLVPDLPAMDRAIKTHADEHRKRKRSEQSNTTASSNISQLLSQLSLIKISGQNDN